jgi:hypothetical protein
MSESFCALNVDAERNGYGLSDRTNNAVLTVAGSQVVHPRVVLPRSSLLHCGTANSVLVNH